MKLLMLKIGARPKGRIIEQHDVIFAIVDDFTQVIDIVNQHWHEVKNKWHIDAWQEITRVGDYKIQLVKHLAQNGDVVSQSLIQSFPKNSQQTLPENRLFFINLGGYLPDMFEEFHYKTLVVAPTMAHATAHAKTLDFYKTYDLTAIDTLTGINGVSHVDDKLGVDVDDIHCVNDLIQDYSLNITALTESEKIAVPHDDRHIGYLSIKKIKNFFAESF